MKIYKVSFINDEGTIVEWYGSRQAAIKRSNNLQRQQDAWDRKQISGKDGEIQTLFDTVMMECDISKTEFLQFLNLYCGRDG